MFCKHLEYDWVGYPFAINDMAAMFMYCNYNSNLSIRYIRSSNKHGFCLAASELSDP